jgi:hypothetical protein
VLTDEKKTISLSLTPPKVLLTNKRWLVCRFLSEQPSPSGDGIGLRLKPPIFLPFPRVMLNSSDESSESRNSASWQENKVDENCLRGALASGFRSRFRTKKDFRNLFAKDHLSKNRSQSGKKISFVKSHPTIRDRSERSIH